MRPRCGKFFPVLLVLLGGPVEAQSDDPGLVVRGMTISCQTWGQEWAQDGFGDELDRLRGLGVNWVAIHPYARIHADGRVSWRGALDEGVPAWISRPIEEAHARGMRLLLKPHLAYWGSPFRWRGDIRFDEPAARARFWETYRAWILRLAEVGAGADGFCVGTELGGLGADETHWRELTAGVRARTGARLTYAANWDDFDAVRFWDALDAVGVQAYFPLSDREDPDLETLRAGWRPVLARLRAVHAATGKPVVFTELGYDRSLDAAREPWADRTAAAEDLARAEALQSRCLTSALEVLQDEVDWLRGAFLWKWFVGRTHERETFLVDTPHLRAVLHSSWVPDPSPVR